MINCPWCSKPFEPTESGRCPHCGTLPPAGEKPEAAEPGPARDDPGRQPQPGPRSIFDVLLGPEGGGLPWERRGDLGLLKGLWLTVRGVLTSPLRTYRAMRHSGGYLEPLSFALLVATPSFLLNALLHGAARRAAPVGAADPWALVMPADETVRLIVELGLAPVFALLLPLLGALGAHLCLRLFRQPGSGFEVTCRVLCYTLGAAAPLAIFPLCGTVLLVTAYLVLGTVGLVLTQRSRVLPAFGALAIPPALAMILLGMVMSAITVARAGGAQ